jgi:5-methylcytosine-specific restriction protein A
MPNAPKRPCRHPGCPALTRERYCEQHARQHARESWQRMNALPRESAARRGYDRKWAECRKAYLAAHPLCEDCLAEGRTAAAVLVHHKEPVDERPDLRLNWENLRGLCRNCHEIRHGRAKRHA